MELAARQARHSLSHTSLPALPAPREAILLQRLRAACCLFDEMLRPVKMSK
jgi:hypothetical protein